MKPQIAWIITTGKIMMPFTTRSSRRGTINEFLDYSCGPNETWDSLKKKGYNVLKVQLVPATTTAPKL